MRDKFINLNGVEVRTNDISAVLEIDRTINYSQSSSNTTYFLPLIVGGQRLEIKGKNQEEVIQMRDALLTRLGLTQS